MKANQKKICLAVSYLHLWFSIIVIYLNRSLFFCNSLFNLNINAKLFLFSLPNFMFNIDFISSLFIFLTSLLIINSNLVSWYSVKSLNKEFNLLLVLTNFLLTFLFLSYDFILFYILFEIILIPIFIIIII